MTESALQILLSQAMLHRGRDKRWKAHDRLRKAILKLKSRAMKARWIAKFNEKLNSTGMANNEYHFLFINRQPI